MPRLALTPEEWEALQTLATHTPDARLRRRAQARLWLAAGAPVQEVAARLRGTRQAISPWGAWFRQRPALERAVRLAPGQHTGRPRTVHGVIEPLSAAVIERDPRKRGYRSTVWTAPLLRCSVGEVHHLEVSRPRVSLASARLRWKRPRHTLSRRSVTWRQANGGSSAVWRGGSGRSSGCWMRQSSLRRPRATRAMAASASRCACRSRARLPDAYSMGSSISIAGTSSGGAQRSGFTRRSKRSSPCSARLGGAGTVGSSRTGAPPRPPLTAWGGRPTSTSSGVSCPRRRQS